MTSERIKFLNNEQLKYVLMQTSSAVHTCEHKIKDIVQWLIESIIALGERGREGAGTRYYL